VSCFAALSIRVDHTQQLVTPDASLRSAWHVRGWFLCHAERQRSIRVDHTQQL